MRRRDHRFMTSRESHTIEMWHITITRHRRWWSHRSSSHIVHTLPLFFLRRPWEVYALSILKVRWHLPELHVERAHHICGRENIPRHAGARLRLLLLVSSDAR